jgi:hypothetical protein
MIVQKIAGVPSCLTRNKIKGDKREKKSPYTGTLHFIHIIALYKYKVQVSLG